LFWVQPNIIIAKGMDLSVPFAIFAILRR